MTVLYVDSSALIKRLFVEAGSEVVRERLKLGAERGELMASSELAWVEVARALRRAGTRNLDRDLGDAFAGIARRPLSSALVESACRIGPPLLRSLEALHLAAAMTLGATELLTFDDRLADAGQALGLNVIR